MDRLRLGSTKKAATKLALMGAATATATALALGPAPHAAALDVTQDVYTTGPLAGVLAGLGVTSIGPIPINIDPVGPITLTLNLVGPIEGGPTALYDTVNALDFQRRNAQVTQFPQNIYDRVLPGSPRQFPATLGIGLGASDLVKAYRAEIASVTSGNTDVPAGYSDWQKIAPKETQALGSGCAIRCPQVQPTYVTNQALLFVRNSYRPNGGILSRFGPLLNLFGVDTSMPDAGLYQSPPIPSSANNGQPANPALALNTSTLDLAWAYDPTSDFPETLNPFSLANTAFAALPTNLLGGVELKGVDLAVAGFNIASTLGIVNRETFNTIFGIDTGQAWYGTLLPNDLPILEPLRLPSRLINAVFNAIGIPLNLGTPIADALQPAMKILVNTGYADVITPDKLNDCATKCGTADAKTYAQMGYTAYDRSFLTSGDYTTFLSQAPLTPQEWLQVPGDVIKALIGGITTEIQKIFTPGAAAIPSSVAAGPKSAPAPTATSLAPAANEPSVPEVTTASDSAAADDITVKPAVTATGNTPSTPSPSTGSTKPAKPGTNASFNGTSAGNGSAHKSGVGGTKRSASND